MTLKSLELFAGAGGMALGFEKAGFQHVGLVEYDHDCCETLRKNRPHWNIIEQDIKDVNFLAFKGKVDVITGGFPCQPFSILTRIDPADDDRGYLIYEFIKAVNIIQPLVFLCENVPTIKSKNTTFFKSIEKLLYSTGYNIHTSILDTAYFNVPQGRKRFICVGTHPKLLNNFTFLKPSLKPCPLREAWEPGRLYDTVPYSYGKLNTTIPQKFIKYIDHLAPGKTYKTLPKDLYDDFRKNYKGWVDIRLFRLSLDMPSRAVTSSFYYVHPTENRMCSFNEISRIQTFPDDWEFYGGVQSIRKQLGNAVPINFAAAMATQIKNFINSQDALSDIREAA